MAEYSQITDPALQRRVDARYRDAVASLQSLGFRRLAYCAEALGPYTALTRLPVLLLAWFHREVLLFPRPLRLAVANVLLAHLEPPSIALCMGMGVKFYTAFSDGTLLVSSDFPSYAVPRPGSCFIRLPPSTTRPETWRAHQEQVKRLQSEGRGPSPGIGFQDYEAMSDLEESLSMPG